MCVWEGGHLPRNQNKTGNSPYLLNHPNSNHLKPRFCVTSIDRMDIKLVAWDDVLFGGGGGGIIKHHWKIVTGFIIYILGYLCPQIYMYLDIRKCVGIYKRKKKRWGTSNPTHSILMLRVWNRVARKCYLGACLLGKMVKVKVWSSLQIRIARHQINIVSFTACVNIHWSKRSWETLFWFFFLHSIGPLETAQKNKLTVNNLLHLFSVVMIFF